MTISAYGGAVTESNNNPSGNYNSMSEVLELPTRPILNHVNIYKMALPVLLSGNCRLDYLNDYGAYGENSAFFEVVPPYFQGAKTEEGFDVGEMVASMMYEDFGNDDRPFYVIDYNNPRTISWSTALTCILRMGPVVIDECLEKHQIFSLPTSLALFKTRLASQIIRETCKWLIERKEIPCVRNATQAIIYLLSSCPCHSQIGMYWFARNPSSLNSRSAWMNKHPGLAYFFTAQLVNEEPCALLSACSS